MRVLPVAAGRQHTDAGALELRTTPVVPRRTRPGDPLMDIFLQQMINGLVLGSMYALVALGYTMVYGIVNLINFAHGEVLMVGALTSWTVATALGGMGPPGW